MRTQKSLLFLVFFSLFSSTILPVKASQYGLAKLRYEEFIYLENDVDKVIKVEPNDIGHIRMSRHLQSNNFPPEDISSVASEEFTTAKISIAEAHSLIGSSSSLPSSVNNSLLPSFPPIGDQGQLGSCVAWGSTYYQASHEIGLLNGYNNKTSFTHVLSPKWMYDLIDGGEDEGSSVSFAYQVLSVNGAASILSFPYNNNYTAWDLNTQDWIAAMSNRLSSYSLIPGLNGNLTAIKQALNNGHVLTFATFIDSWQFTIIKRDPLNLNNLHVGEYACTYMNGQNGGHFMTIVGYDDTLWIDINGNGRVDSGERGAFLIANSWGSNWGNHGFIWIAYDAFLSQSAVIHGPSVGRVPAGIYLNNSVIMVSPKAANYTPSLVAEFALTQHTRNQITAQIGASSTSQNRPTSLITILGNQGGALEFNGSAPSSRLETVTFAADLTDLLPSDSTTNRYYLSVGDSTAGNPTTLYSFALIDTIHNRQVRNSFQPKSYDNTSGLVYIDYAFRAIGSAPPTIAFTTPSEAAVLTGIVPINLSVYSDESISSVAFYVDSNLVKTWTGAPYQVSLDTTKMTNGSHSIRAIATDSLGNSAETSVFVQTKNKVSIYTNAGGASLSYGGVTWASDLGVFRGTTSVLTSNLSFVNPIYRTERLGNMTYTYAVPNGQYYVTLKFSENKFKGTNKRIFSVAINRNKVINNFDLFSKAGYGKPYDLTFLVNVTNGSIGIDFISKTNEAQINGIQIISK